MSTPVTIGFKAASIITGMMGKDTDYPFMQGIYQIKDGIAVQGR